MFNCRECGCEVLDEGIGCLSCQKTKEMKQKAAAPVIAQGLRSDQLQTVVTSPGRDQRGEPILDAVISLPDVDDLGEAPSDRQIAAAAKIVGEELAIGMTEEQIGTLLNWRDFAEAVAEWKLEKLPRWASKHLSIALIAFISQDDDLRGTVTRYMDGRFKRHADPDTLVENVKALAWIDRVEWFVDALAFDLERWAAPPPRPEAIQVPQPVPSPLPPISPPSRSGLVNRLMRAIGFNA